VGRVSCAPHDPCRGSCKSTGESEHLNSGISLEGGVWNDTILNCVCCPCSDRDGSEHLEDGAEYHCLSVADGPGGDTGRPGVRNIVYQSVNITTPRGGVLRYALAPLLNASSMAKNVPITKM
jgi:hypothetical protein